MLELLKENLIPAVDRCAIILSNLHGLAQYHKQTPDPNEAPLFDVPVGSFTTLLEITKCIRLVSHHILLIASQEFQRFAAFSKWLRWIIEVKSTDPRSAAGEELMERDPGVDYLLVLAYIQDGLIETNIDRFIGNPSTESTLKVDLEMYDRLRKSLKRFKDGDRDDLDVMDLASFCTECQRHNRTLIDQITSWQRGNTIIPGVLKLPTADVACCDVRMVSENLGQPDTISSYVVAVSSSDLSKGKTKYCVGFIDVAVSLHRIVHQELFDDLTASVISNKDAAFEFEGQEVVDARFIDDQDVMIVFKAGDESRLTVLPFRSGSGNQLGIPYAPAGENAPPKKIGAETLSKFTRHVINHAKESFEPRRLEVNGRENRRSCVVVGDDGRQIRIYDLDAVGS